jgi:hypothetical protein
LNPQAPTVGGSVNQLLTDGAFSYAQVRPSGVQRVLDDALAAYRARGVNRDVEEGLAR